MRKKNNLPSAPICDSIGVKATMKLSKNDKDLIKLKNKVEELIKTNSINHLNDIINSRNTLKEGKLNELSKMW